MALIVWKTDDVEDFVAEDVDVFLVVACVVDAFVVVACVVVARVVVVGDVVPFAVVEDFEEVDCEDLVDDTVLDVVRIDEDVVPDAETAYATIFASWKLTPPPGLTIARFGSCFTKGSLNVTTSSKGRLRAPEL